MNRLDDVVRTLKILAATIHQIDERTCSNATRLCSTPRQCVHAKRDPPPLLASGLLSRLPLSSRQNAHVLPALYAVNKRQDIEGPVEIGPSREITQEINQTQSVYDPSFSAYQLDYGSAFSTLPSQSQFAGWPLSMGVDWDFNFDSTQGMYR